MSKEVILLDGSMGTQLQVNGLKSGETPEDWNLEHPEKVRAIQENYLKAGADILYTNTFGANALKYHGRYSAAEVTAAGTRLAREAASAVKPGARVALDIGPTGRLLKPVGDLDFESAVEAFALEVKAGVEAGADLIVVETMTDTLELKAAVIAAKENSKLPVYATVALQENGTLLTGGSVESVAVMLEGLGVDAYGFNCGMGPDLLLPFVKRLAAVSTKPIIVKANAGLPKIVEGKTVFTVSPEEFAAAMAECIEAGASIVGGCCGTTPEHVENVKWKIENEKYHHSTLITHTSTLVSSGSRVVELPLDDSVIIGERINPTGKKKLREAYKAGDTAYILREAVAQIEAGAQILDVNAGVPGIDEATVLAKTVEEIQGITDLPLQIDTSDPVALERALRRYNGKALVNSVNGKRESMDAVFPIVKKYGGVIVALTLDESGIPPTADGRVAIARRILDEGAKYGFTEDDFLIDVLCLAVSAESESGKVILESLRRVREELGCRTVLGVSNISFGLPNRPLLNGTFYTLALGAGLSAAIVNPLSLEMMSAWKGWRALTGRDRGCTDWIGFADVCTGGLGAAGTTSPRQQELIDFSIPRLIDCTTAGTTSARQQEGGELQNAIVKGLKADAAAIAAAKLEGGAKPVELIDGEIVPALETVGRGFEKGKLFLPQLLMAAEAAGAAFEVIRAKLKAGGEAAAEKGPIVIATVKGDIHDIGKNIVRALLENYGFKVIDLGRDVAPETIVEAAVRSHCRLVGLSALMTTTTQAMAETIRQLAAADPEIKTFVGGAVITEDFAKEIHATYYTRDAMASVRLAEKIFA